MLPAARASPVPGKRPPRRPDQPATVGPSVANGSGECLVYGVAYDWRWLLTAEGIRDGAPRRSEASWQTIKVGHEEKPTSKG